MLCLFEIRTRDVAVIEIRTKRSVFHPNVFSLQNQNYLIDRVTILLFLSAGFRSVHIRSHIVQWNNEVARDRPN